MLKTRSLSHTFTRDFIVLCRKFAEMDIERMQGLFKWDRYTNNTAENITGKITIPVN